MKKTITLTIGLIIAFFLISCSNKNIPIGLRNSIRNIDANLNDTVKYDFKIAPENIATSKHHFRLGLGIRNGKNLWKGGLLSLYFRINGINHPDDMSGIILTTYHRKLNDKPIQFKQQKQYYKEFWEVSNLGRDTLNKWWQYNNSKENAEREEIVYFSKFEKGKKVLGSINAWKKRENGMSGHDVNYIAEIVARKGGNLDLRILKIGKPQEGYELDMMVGDTIKNEPDGVFLIPEQ